MGVMKHDIRFGGIVASEKDVIIYGGNVDEVAERDVEAVEIPGRNGVLHLDNGRWRERTQTYLAYVKGENYPARIAYVRRVFGRMGKTYARLDDTFNPDVYSMATFVDALVPESLAFRTQGLVTLTFQCRPERYLRTGDQTITTTSSVTLVNPTGLPARPLIRVYVSGGGTVTVGNKTMTISSSLPTAYVDIDADTQDCTSGATNCNNYVTLVEFPTFGAGSTGVSLGGGATSAVITPRWWTL